MPVYEQGLQRIHPQSDLELHELTKGVEVIGRQLLQVTKTLTAIGADRKWSGLWQEVVSSSLDWEAMDFVWML